MVRNRTLNVTVSGEEIERLVLILNIGFMTSIEEEVISAEESQFRFYSPYTVGQLKKRRVDAEILSLHLKALELDDIKNLVSKERFLDAVKEIKQKSIEMLKKLPCQNELGYRHWVKQDNRLNDLHIKVDREERQVIINEKQIGGCFVDSYCPDCGHKQIYHDKYDEEFCPRCNEWAKPVCGDENCSFCKERPEKPLKQD